MLLESDDIERDLRDSAEDGLFFGMSLAALQTLAAWRAVSEQRDSLMLFFGDALVGNDVAQIELNLDLVLGFAYLYATTNPGHRDRVAVGVQGHISFHIHHALVQTINFGNPDGQRLEMKLFEGKQLAWNRVNVFFVCGVDAVAPLSGVLVQVLPTGEGTARP